MITSKNRAVLQSEMPFFCASTRHFTTIRDIYDRNLLFDSEARRNEFHYFVELEEIKILRW